MSMKQKLQISEKLQSSILLKTSLFFCIFILTQGCGIKGKPLPPVKQPFATPSSVENATATAESSDATKGVNKNSKKQKAKK